MVYNESVKKAAFFLIFFTLLTLTIPLGLAQGEDLTPTPTPDPQKLEEDLQKTQKEILEKSKEKSQKEEGLQAAKQKEETAAGSLNYFQDKLVAAQQNLQATLTLLNQKISEFNQTIENLNQTGQQLAHQQDLLRLTTRSFYIESFTDNFSLLFTSPDFSDSTKTLIYRQKVVELHKKQIQDLNLKIQNLQEEKKVLENQKLIIETQKTELEKRKVLYQGEVASAQQSIKLAQNEQVNLMQALAGLASELSSLSAKEQEILRAKAAAALASTTVGNFEVTRAAIEKDAPADGNLYFSFWTYGFPHRVGMNQYGAYGRAKAGQSAKTILTAYYAGIEIQNYPAPTTIKILENGGEREIALEDEYLMGLGEMPSCWGKPEKGGFEALKAQVIAARSYALSYTQNGQSSICTTQKCQVYVGSVSKLSGECGNYWKQAVEETRGQVITYQGQPISAWYASTAGGFTLSSKEAWGKATAWTQGIADLDGNFKPFDGPDYGNSPWYHKAWGNEPWLSVAQVEDLLNAALLPEGYNQYLPLPEKGGYTTAEILQKLNVEKIAPIEGLSALEVLGSNSKNSTRLRAYHKNGAVEIDAARFKFIYNLRSPGTNAVWTSRFDAATNQ